MIELRPAKYLLGRLVPMDNNDKIPLFNLGSGTYDNTKFLRGDGTWAVPSGGGGSYVPYTGATGNVDLGEYGLSAGWVQIDTSPTTYTPGVGKLGWNNSDGTLEFQLLGGNVTLQIGQEQVARVVNKTDPLIDLLESNYQVVKITGAQGNRLKIALAQANNDANSAETLGLVTEDIPRNQEGFITTSGIVRNINTTGLLQGETWADGDMLYLSGTVAGQMTKVKPVAPIHTVILGYVIRAHATQGQIYVKVDNGYELGELHDVNTNLSKATPVDTDSLLLQDTADSNIWKKLSWLNTKATLKTYFDTLYQAIGSYVPSSRTITINSTTQDLSTNRSWTIDKASVGLGNVDNTSDLNKPISTATQTALNAKQDNITLTTTGTSGAATLVGATLNIPQYQSVITNPITGTGINNYVSKFTGTGSIGNSLIYDDSSSVGIGTTALQSRFHIYHTSAPSFNAVIGYNAMKLEYDGGNNEDDFGAGITFFQKWFSGSSLKVATGGIFGVKTNGDGNFGGGLSFFYTPLGSSTLTEGARLTSAGHFGIGTIYPITKFQVRDGDGNFYVGNSFAKVENAGGTTASFYLADLTDSVALKNVGANLLFFNSSSEGMRLTNSGNLAIGRTTASEKLHIAGNMILDGVSNITSISTSAFGTLVSFDVASLDYTFGPITANPMTYGLTFSGNDIMFGNINSGAIPYKATIGFSDSPMFVNGLDIGIGTTSPLAKLHIYNGNLFVESGNIETSGSLRIAQQLIDSVYSAGNPNQFLISNSVGTLWSDLKTVNGNSLVGSGNISVQSTLVSGTNIKTINGSTILGSGDLTISGGSGLKGVHALIPLKSGDITNTVMISVNPLSSTAFTTNRLVAYPFIPNQDFTSSDLFINVNTLAAGSFCRIAVYSDLNGYPNTRLFVSSDLDCSTTGKKTALATINFVAGTTYWLVFHGGAVASTLSCILQAQSIPIKSNTVTSMANSYFYALAFTTPTPATFLANQSAISQNLQYIGITKA